VCRKQSGDFWSGVDRRGCHVNNAKTALSPNNEAVYFGRKEAAASFC
jgi:hypothetical protein